MQNVVITSRNQIEGLVRGWIDKMVWRQEIRRADSRGFDILERDEIDTLGLEDSRELESLLRFCGDQIEADQKKAINEVLTGKRDPDEFEPIIQSAARTINVSADPTTLEGRLMARTILRGYATLLDEVRETRALIPRLIPQTVPIPTFLFFKFWEAFQKEKTDKRRWKDDTKSNSGAARNLFERLMPGLPIAQLIDSAVVSDYHTKLLKLPKHYSRGDWAEMSFEKMVEVLEKDKSIPKLEPTTVNKHFGYLSEYWGYLVTKKHVSENLKNPFIGFFLKKKSGRGARDERFNWTKPLEKKLFESPLYRGCASIHRRALPGDEIHRDALFWAPLFGRTMGVRENEICDALVGNIKSIETEEGWIPYLEILDGKEAGSERDVPLSNKTLEAGFLEYRVIGRDPNEPLFPELVKQGPELRRSAAFSGRFTTYRQNSECYQVRTDFHSFRGNAETDVKNHGGLDSAWIDELIGHISDARKSEGNRYTKKIYMPILRRCVNAIKLNADISHLTYTGSRGVAAPGRDQEIARYVALAQREMKKKVSRRRDTAGN
jgi:hypothetical protein